MTAKKTFSYIIRVWLMAALLTAVTGCKSKVEETPGTGGDEAATSSPQTPDASQAEAGEEAVETYTAALPDGLTADDTYGSESLDFPASPGAGYTGIGSETPRTFAVDDEEDEEETMAFEAPAATAPAPAAEKTPAAAGLPPTGYYSPASSSVFDEAANAGAAARNGEPIGRFPGGGNFAEMAAPGDAHSPASGGGMADDNGYITLIEDIEVPAQEAGVLVELKVKEGDTVKMGALLGRVDDEQAQMSVEVSEAKLKAAERKAANDVNIRYAKAAKDVAYQEIVRADAANKRVPATVPEAEYQRYLLSHKQAELQIEQATHDYMVAKYDMQVQHVELKAAELGVTRRMINAPTDGIVLERFRHQGEWVKPGDPLLRLARLDVVRLKFQLDARQVPMAGVRGRNVTITAPLLPGKSFHGKVTFVDPVLIAGSKYQVWVEIQNVQENGEWQLKPAMRANAKLK